MSFATPISEVRTRVAKLKSIVDGTKVMNLGLAVKKAGMTNFLYSTALQHCGFVHKNGDRIYKWSGPITDARIAKAIDCVRKMQRLGYSKSVERARKQPDEPGVQTKVSDDIMAAMSADIAEIKREFNVLKVVLYNLQNRGIA